MANSSRLPTDGGLTADLKQSLLARRGLLFALVIVVVGAVCAQLAWMTMRERMRGLPEYELTASSVSLTPQPTWLGADVKTEALQASGLLSSLSGERLSILDPPDRLEERLATALGFHPWVKRVGAMKKSPPNLIAIEVEYRTPLAAVKTGKALTPIDVEASVLPAHNLSPIELGYLPRINLMHAAGESGPRPGQVWQSPAIVGAVALIERLKEHWDPLHLLDITPSRSPEVRGDHRYPTYELRTKGGTHIVWGAAPGFEPLGESPFEEKLKRLTQFVEQNGSLGSVHNSPKRIDIREETKIVPRVAKDPTNKTAQASREEVVK